MKTMYIFFALATYACVALGQEAQPSRVQTLADSSPARILATLGANSSGLSSIADIVRGRHGLQSSAKTAELADSLMRRAFGAARERGTRLLSLAAVSALGRAGALGGSGMAYPGSLDRLIRIHREGHERVVRAFALGLLPGVVGWQRGMQYLQQVAASTDSTAYNAAEALIVTTRGGSQGGPFPSADQQRTAKRLLWEILDRKLVRDEHAALLIEAWSNSPEGKR